MTKQLKRQSITIFLLVVLLMCAFFASLSIPSSIAFGANGYTDVLTDLRKDTSFDPSYYSAKANDYGLEVIQIAESTDKELFVYVYQPCLTYDLRASSINISRTTGGILSPHNYLLRYIDSDGVFYKYSVTGLTVASDDVRTYEITSILRSFNAAVDADLGLGQTVSEVPYNVGKKYILGTLNGQPYCREEHIETITVTSKFVGYCRYSNGFSLYQSSCDSHFVAFDTDRSIDQLLEAEIEYKQQSYVKNSPFLMPKEETYGDPVVNHKVLKHDDPKGENPGGGLFAPHYEWNRIETVKEFLQQEMIQNVYSGAVFNVSVGNQIDEQAKAELSRQKWVLRFTETDYFFSSTELGQRTSQSFVGDVIILRLMFVTDGLTYNLGVVDNKQTGSTDPINEENIDVQFTTGFKTILAVILIVLLVILLAPVLPYVIKGIVWLVCLPFRAIKSIVSTKDKKKRK